MSTRSSPSRTTHTSKETQLDIVIRDATLSDSSQISQLGTKTYRETFQASVPPEDLQIYLDEVFSHAAIQAELADATKHFLVACCGMQILGFAQLTEGTSEPCLSSLHTNAENDLIELQRLYLEAMAQGFGLGRKLILEAESRARMLGYAKIWLGVWEGNVRARRVYEKSGYKQIGEHEFVSGTCVQTDLILWKEL